MHRKPNIQFKFKHNDGTVTDDKEIISESLNQFFINIGPTLVKSIPCINKPPLGSMWDMIMNLYIYNP